MTRITANGINASTVFLHADTTKYDKILLAIFSPCAYLCGVKAKTLASHYSIGTTHAQTLTTSTAAHTAGREFVQCSASREGCARRCICARPHDPSAEHPTACGYYGRDSIGDIYGSPRPVHCVPVTGRDKDKGRAEGREAGNLRRGDRIGVGIGSGSGRG